MICVLLRNLQNRDPDVKSEADANLLDFIWRKNFDILWGSTTRTVQSTKSFIKKGLLMCSDLGYQPSYQTIGPYPIEDNVGFIVALQMLKASLLPSKYSNTHQQFDTIRNLHSAFSNIYELLFQIYMSRVGKGVSIERSYEVIME